MSLSFPPLILPAVERTRPKAELCLQQAARSLMSGQPKMKAQILVKLGLDCFPAVSSAAPPPFFFCQLCQVLGCARANRSKRLTRQQGRYGRLASSRHFR